MSRKPPHSFSSFAWKHARLAVLFLLLGVCLGIVLGMLVALGGFDQILKV